MASRTFAWEGWTATAVADANAFTDNGYMALQGGSSTQNTCVTEVYMGGLATVSSPTPMVLARDSTVGATLTALTTAQSDGPTNPATAALAAPVAPFTASTTKPQRSASAGRLALGFNAFGGIVRWVARDSNSAFWILGASASNGEISLSAFTGGTPGLMNAHLMYETL